VEGCLDALRPLTPGERGPNWRVCQGFAVGRHQEDESCFFISITVKLRNSYPQEFKTRKIFRGKPAPSPKLSVYPKTYDLNRSHSQRGISSITLSCRFAIEVDLKPSKVLSLVHYLSTLAGNAARVCWNRNRNSGPRSPPTTLRFHASPLVRDLHRASSDNPESCFCERALVRRTRASDNATETPSAVITSAHKLPLGIVQEGRNGDVPFICRKPRAISIIYTVPHTVFFSDLYLS
jgi:hypothetical protein